MHKFFLIIFTFVLLTFETVGQTNSALSISNSTLVSTSDKMPFWLWANTDGKIEADNSFLNLSEINGSVLHFFNDSNSYIKTGAQMVYGAGNTSQYFQPNQLFAGINLNNWELNIGLYHNNLLFDGLSSTNGDLSKSRNARPYPRITISISEYKPVPFLNKILSFKGEFSEGILNDNRFVNNTLLHHKSLYFKIETFQNFDIQAGLEHFVMWAGTSQNKDIGDLPRSASDYLRYITGRKGDEGFLPTDQINVAGNQYGTYQILLTKKFDKFEASLNISHPFEDMSGLRFQNWPDNLIGLSLKLKNTNKLITHFLYEFTNTRQQGVTDSLYVWLDEQQEWHRSGADNYYNHGIYRSGATYFNKMMGSPLFLPVIIKDGISRGSGSTRFFAHHIGLKGKIHKDVEWKSMVTFIRHFGFWGNPYEKPQNQTSFLLNFLFTGDQIPFNIELTVAGDIADTYQNNLGAQLGLHYYFNHN